MKKIVLLFTAWRMWLFVFALLGILILPPRSTHFFGGGIGNYLEKPLFWGWANFDGEHYLSIAQIGYRGLEQAFFPVYPLLMRLLAWPFSTGLFGLVGLGLFVSNLSTFISLFILWRLVKLDFTDKIADYTLITLLLFPTSFYLGSLYNESLFLLLVVSSFYSARMGKWWLAGLLGALSSATRIFGILLFPSLLLEAFSAKVPLRKSFWIFLLPLGLVFYIIYQGLTIGDPLAFYNLQLLVGEQHQRGLILLPQVFFRYLKMLLTVNRSDPIYQTILLEFVVGILFTVVPIYGYLKKIRLSYLFFTLVGFLTPTIQGSFSSVPRYVLVFFPAFVIISIFLNNAPKIVRTSFIILSSLGLGLNTALFIRGYWIA